MMKRFLFFFFLFVFTAGINAQNQKDFAPERYMAELEQYITNKACLTPKEASRFFPVYAEMWNKQRNVRKEMRSLKRLKPTSDSECKKNIKKRDELEIEMKEIQKTYHNKFLQILPAKKVYDILNAEDKFHKQMFKKTANKNRKKK